MKFSIILATISRYNEVVLFLDSLLKQTYKNFELIIVDQNDDNKIELLCNNYIFNIQVIKSKLKGLSINRNLGLNHISGDLVAFPDDDCEYNVDTLEKVAAFFTENPEYDFCTFNTKEKNSDLSVVTSLSKDRGINQYNVMQTGISFTIFVRSFSLNSFRFDEQLGIGADFGSAEESDLVYFLLKNNNKGFYFSKNYIYHPHKPDTVEKAYLYGKGYGAIHKKAVFYYGYYLLFILFLYTLCKETVKIFITFFSRCQIAMVKGRIYGFLHYKNKQIQNS